jgi:hypothetical protein
VHASHSIALSLMSRLRHVQALTQSADDDVGALSWNTGIAEVALPIEFKLKNIEETESAMKKLQVRTCRHQLCALLTADRTGRARVLCNRFRCESLDARPRLVITCGSDNLTVNYALRRLRVVHQHPSSGSKRNGAKERSTDDWAFERFKKRHRHF